MNRPTPVSAALLGLLFCLASSGPAPAQSGQCLGPAAQQAALNSGQIAPLRAVLAQAGLTDYKPVGPVSVCKQGGRWVYIVTLLDARGDAQSKALPAGR